MYVELYHDLIYDIQNEMGQNLSYFEIPSGYLKQKSAPIRDNYGEVQEPATGESYCEREMFLIKLKGAINFINSLILDKNDITIKLIEPEPE